MSFNSKGTMCNISISTYLLEKSRVATIADPERNYHIFYQLLSGDAAERAALRLTDRAQDYSFLKRSSSQTIPGVSDVEEFAAVRHALTSVGVPHPQQQQVFRIVAGLLHLGNVSFKPQSDISDIAVVYTPVALEAAASLLGTTSAALSEVLTRRELDGLRGVVTKKELNVPASGSSRDSLCKVRHPP